MGHPFRGQGALLALLVPFLAGLSLSLAAGPAGPAAAFLLVPVALALVALRAPRGVAAFALVAVAGAAAGTRAGLVDPADARPFLGGETILRGTVAGVSVRDHGWVGTATDAVVSLPDGSRAVVLKRVRCTIRNPDAAVSFPAEVRAFGRLVPLRGPGNPGEVPREWGAVAEGVQYLFAADARRVVFLRPAATSGGAALFSRLREKTGTWIARHAGTSGGGLYLRALATGEVPPPSHPTVALLRRTGLSHLLAISGINVAAFFAVAAALARGGIWAARRRHGSPDLGAAAALAAVPACWGYVALAGAPVSAVRAAGMITAAVLLRRLRAGRGGGLPWSLLLVATVAASPRALLSPPFLLSYGAAFFLVAEFSGRAGGKHPGGAPGRAVRAARDAVVASAVAFCGTLPASAAFFRALPAGAVLWNALFGPLLGAAGLAGAVLSVAGGLLGADALGGAVGVLARGIDLVLHGLALLSGDGRGYLPLPPPGPLAPVAATGAAAAAALVLRDRGRAAWPGVLAASLLFLAWIHHPALALPRSDLEVVALNAGRGSALVVSFPGGGTALIDAGSALGADAGRTVVAPALRAGGVRRIDLLVLTHPQEDHAGGAEAILEAFPVGEVWVPDGTAPADFGAAVVARADRVRAVSAGTVFARGGATLAVRAPRPGPEPGKRAAPKARGRRPRNRGGLVLELRHGAVSVWLPGDAEEGPGAWGPVRPECGERRFLFLPHHGSPGADPGGWILAARPEGAAAQKADCPPPRNLLPSCEVFFLENGALTLRSDGRALSRSQAGGSRFLRRLWRLE